MALALSVAVLLGTAPLRGQKAADAAGQARSILALASEPWHIIFGLAAVTGLGPGQVLSPSIDDLDLEQRLIFVRRLAWYRHLISPKSARSVATIPMPGSLAELLTNYPEASRAAASLRGAKAHSAGGGGASGRPHGGRTLDGS